MSNLPNYTITESPRAKHVRLKMSVRDGLVVIVPKGFDHSRVPHLVQSKKAWIEAASGKIDQQRKFFEPEPPGSLPERIILRALGEEWSVEYRETDYTRVLSLERPSRKLLVSGDIGNAEACKDALKRWLNRKAHEHLVPWLKLIADERKFVLNRVLVKSQKTRWASCSRHKTVSINQKLLFIQYNLVRYVFMHELCHTLHMNHSDQFWALVRENARDYKQRDEELREAWRLVPAWISRPNTKGEPKDLY